MLRTLFRSNLFQSLLGSLIAFYMTLLARTVRWEVEGEEHLRAAWEGETGFVIAFWHSRIPLLPFVSSKLQKRWARPNRIPSMIISNSPDGEFVARACHMIKVHPIRGSAANPKKARKDKGGVAALREANTRLLNGEVVCITPDGPRGPRETASLGAIKIAQRAGVKIYPCGIAASPASRLKSWDRTLMPRPFGRGKMIIQPPIEAPRDIDDEQLRLELEVAMRDATDRAEREVGLTLVPRPEPKTDASHADAMRTAAGDAKPAAS